jgi:hypothetical protein
MRLLQDDVILKGDIVYRGKKHPTIPRKPILDSDLKSLAVSIHSELTI